MMAMRNSDKKFLEMLSKSNNFNLINAANVKSGLLIKNFVRSVKELTTHNYELNGLPILIAADKTVFDFSKNDVFELSKVDLCARIYGHQDLSYIGFRHAYKTNQYISEFKVKSEFEEQFKVLINQNHNCLSRIQKLKEKKGRIGAFQTRNIPHSGHEAIIKSMLENCDHIVINPVMGPKKKGDIRFEALEKIFSNLTRRKYAGKLSFNPIIANMFYAGPKEAIHHAVLRQNLGFDLFSVGRDHAGADGYYKPNAATELIKKYSHLLNIDIMCHSGAVFCDKCKKALLLGACKCDKKYIRDIAGTEFRRELSKKRIYPLADLHMQEYILQKKFVLFEK